MPTDATSGRVLLATDGRAVTFQVPTELAELLDEMVQASGSKAEWTISVFFDEKDHFAPSPK